MKVQSKRKSSDDEDPVEIAREMLVKWWPNPIDEWRQRTTWGHLKYPFWMLQELVFFAIFVVATIVLAGPEIVVRVVGRSLVALKKLSPEMPDTYRGEE